MYFLNLSLAEFSALLGAASAIVTALYFIDRARQRRVVSTLRFWTPAKTVEQVRPRRRFADPLSLALQLVSILLLLLAIAGLEWGRRDRGGRDHVLLLDTSAWTAERKGAGTLLDKEKKLAREYVRRVSAADRTLLVRVDELAAPAGPFTRDRARLLREIEDSKPGFGAVNMEQTLEFAARTRSRSGGLQGEIVYIGPGLIQAPDPSAARLSNLRVLAVEADREHVGIRHVESKKDDETGSSHVFVTLKNYGVRPRTVTLEAQFNRAQLADRAIRLAAGDQHTEEYALTNGGGEFRAAIAGADAIRTDLEATVLVPRQGPVRVAVFTARAKALAPLLSTNPHITAKFFDTREYLAASKADVVVFDHFAPAQSPGLPALWICPPEQHSPFRVTTAVTNAVIDGWPAEKGIAPGLRAKQLVASAQVFQTFAGDLVLATASSRPVAIARNSDQDHTKSAAIGFDPVSNESKFEIGTPLLVGSVLDWLAPESAQAVEASTGTVGSTTVPLSAEEASTDIRVLDSKGVAIPFARRGQSVQLFVSRPSIVHINAGSHERVLSLTLPELGDAVFQTPANARTDSQAVETAGGRRPFWQWLAVATACILALEWFVSGRKRTGRRFVPLALKLASLVAIAVALARPTVTLPSAKKAAVVLMDASASIPQRDQKRAANFSEEMQRNRSANWIETARFARDARMPQTAPAPAGWANGTNFEAALMDSVTELPPGHVPRIVLISDGNNNDGSTPRALAQVAQLGIPVDTIALPGRPRNGLRLLSLSMPQQAYSGEQIPIELNVISPVAAHGEIEVSAEGKVLGGNAVELQPGWNQLRVRARLKSLGTASVSGRIAAGTAGELAFEQVIQLRRASVLYLSDDPAGTDANLSGAFGQAGFDLIRDRSQIGGDLSSVQLVVLNNLDFDAFNPQEKAQLAEYVNSGGGLLIIGGERLVYKDEDREDALDHILPARVAPPKTEQGTAVALIVDKSSSMEGRKIELARLSAVGVVDRLRPTDLMGVLMFDNSFQWAVPIRRAEDKSIIKRLISGITADGGTQIAPALGEAYRKILAARAMYKHMVLLTDGISEEGDSFALAEEAARHRVTISTVGLGQDVNRSYLEKVAEISGGRSYFLNEPQGLEQILLKDVKDYGGTTSVEKPMAPVVMRNDPILEGVGIEAAPPLKGYVRFDTKPTAETVLAIDTQKKDPLYVRWQYGLGRVGVFTSDAKSRWAESWVTWPGFDKLWINIARDLLGRENHSQATVEWDPTSRDVLVAYHLGTAAREPEEPPAVFAIGPNGFERPVALQRVAPRLYRGRFHVGDQTGLFRIRPTNDTLDFPETGLYRAEDEFEDYGSNEALLKEISAFTGGRFNPQPNAIFEGDRRLAYTSMELWPALLGLALLLSVTELVARRWKGLMSAARSVFELNHRLHMVGLRE